jgi:hypothetical protein
MPPKASPPSYVAAIRARIKHFLDTKDDEGRAIGSATCGVYLFSDFDGEPIYVGQTVEQLRGRIGRHLTGQRSDAVAKYVLDPAEVAWIEVWPFFDLEDRDKATRKRVIDQAEYAAYLHALSMSQFEAVLNEKSIAETDEIELPRSYKARIVPDEFFDDLAHPDVRLARRAVTIASLARMISEREVGIGIRSTLVTQARRLEHLAFERFRELGGEEGPASGSRAASGAMAVDGIEDEDG